MHPNIYFNLSFKDENKTFSARPEHFSYMGRDGTTIVFGACVCFGVWSMSRFLISLSKQFYTLFVQFYKKNLRVLLRVPFLTSHRADLLIPIVADCPTSSGCIKDCSFFHSPSPS